MKPESNSAATDKRAKLTLRLEPSVKRKFDVALAEDGQTIQDILEQAVLDYLREREAEYTSPAAQQRTITTEEPRYQGNIDGSMIWRQPPRTITTYDPDESEGY